ncbi:leucine-rich repeat-containing protein 73 isoform X2 [Ornithorhynchus anatinus]|uniref:leucine-rich repeat-containing protein 73 isoform X2 n=1 Tax=Ornithorhynchus anatinus TaxID=9258 RepID=UPI0010A8A6E8|nr:leucine-rich repeat-containing protein 73 isoform X2 [Ornithorhynchus anatinus]
MLPGSIQISGEPLSGAEVRDICRGLRDNAVRLLSLRGCRLCDRDFGRICRALAGATALAQLNLNLGVVSSPARVKQLAEALGANRSVQSLFLHGSPLTDAGLALLNPALALHPSLVALDLGDCMLGDEGINLICGLLPPDGAKSGLKELTLSANPGVTPKGWGRLAIAVAHSSQVRVLNLDYNPLATGSTSRPPPQFSSSRPPIPAALLRPPANAGCRPTTTRQSQLPCCNHLPIPAALFQPPADSCCPPTTTRRFLLPSHDLPPIPAALLQPPSDPSYSHRPIPAALVQSPTGPNRPPAAALRVAAQGDPG